MSDKLALLLLALLFAGPLGIVAFIGGAVYGYRLARSQMAKVVEQLKEQTYGKH